MLVGLPGAGKSTVGRHLARWWNKPFVDSDAVIEQRIGCPIGVFFEREGEAAFRDIEEAVIAQLVLGPMAILATGGGAVLRLANRRSITMCRHRLYLHLSASDAFRRLRHDTKRPLLQVADPYDRLRSLYVERDPLYREVATAVVEGGCMSASKLAVMIRDDIAVAR